MNGAIRDGKTIAALLWYERSLRTSHLDHRAGRRENRTDPF